ncbi:hypothetical protein MVES1_002138 [Malassezia vespertilionis]|uniref:uncharacterized protein n=1 Tax=Malassezia vespertilionis TaxID=2020962 RepID=UPI0024B23545|nr:uncharacterized protein MVES1_002138 [Malassezia vespertilionis]WFD06784.1 hypothetical protein MVES1_002138 [Malassezia vespertilionis]
MEELQTMDNIRQHAVKGFDGRLYPPTFYPTEINTMPRAKAGFVVLVRNGDLEEMRSSMRDVEDRFNHEPFNEEFKAGVKKMTRSETRFGLIPKEHWSYPDFIDQDKAADTRRIMTEQRIIYGFSESYRHMCRFNSGFFFHHPLTQDLDYYWRVEPGIKLLCDIDYDPFLFMELNNIKYGFTISMHEYPLTIPTLWNVTREFVKQHPESLAKDNALHFIADDPKKGMDQEYNMCHFWSNFEIADLRFWRSKVYTSYFDFLDHNGGFFYERWGDAPVHSIAASLFLNRSEIHHFEDIGYHHPPWTHCPASVSKFHETGKCLCNPEDSADLGDFFCQWQWWRTSIEGKPDAA